jgi:hypothetical protein
LWAPIFSLITHFNAAAKCFHEIDNVCRPSSLRPLDRLTFLFLFQKLLERIARGSIGCAKANAALHTARTVEVLRVECTKCERKGRYSVAKLIEKYGRDGHIMKWRNQLNDDCPRRDAPQLHDRCELVCPDLPKVL